MLNAHPSHGGYEADEDEDVFPASLSVDGGGESEVQVACLTSKTKPSHCVITLRKLT